MSFLDSGGASTAGSELTTTLDSIQGRTDSIAVSVNGFAGAMTRAFTQATTGGKQFDDVLKSLALRLSSLTVQNAFRPISQGLTGLLSGAGSITPFASGGVIGAPSYFPLANGGLGLAGEAGPEAIVPLSRGSDGRLGVSLAGGGQPANVTVQIATPDAQSFRRSEAYITGQIARAVARGQRSL
jgi:phage-related minor tail protein